MSAATPGTHRVKSLRLGVLASGEGTTLQSVIDACGNGTLAAEVVVAISNNSGSGAARRALRHGIPFVHASGHTPPLPADLDLAVRDTLLARGAEWVLLAGYMKRIGPRTLDAYRGRIVNTHPALLPAFGGQGMYGHRVHEAVLAAGVSTTGVTIHLVDEEYDAGAVLARCEVPVLPGDDVSALSERVQTREKRLLLEVLGGLSEGRIDLAAAPGGVR